MKRTYKTAIAIGLSLVALGAASLSSAQSGKSSKSIQNALQRSALAFRENKGQWDPRARFLAQTPGLDYWVTRDGITIDQYKETAGPESQKHITPFEEFDSLQSFKDRQREGNVVEMHFVNGDLNSGASGAGVRPGVMDYFTSKQSMARSVHSYDEAYITSIYSGVHARHYQVNGSIRYDLIVDPGHDPRQIEMKFNGVNGIDAKGSLLSVETSIGRLNMSDLRVYQPYGNAQKIVPAEWVKTNSGTIKIALGNYDPRLPLVIDPHVFGSYLGSNGTPLTNADEVVSAITAESNGNLYMTGVTSQTTFPVNAGPYGKFNVQGVDAFLCRMDGNAYTVTYSAVLGGTGTDRGLAVGFSEDTRELWVGGTSTSTNFAGANNSKSSGTRVWFSKFIFANTGVQPQFVTFLNEVGDLANANNGVFKSIKVSKNGNVYVAGTAVTSTLVGAGYTNYLTNNFDNTKRAGWVIAMDSSANALYRTMIAGKQHVTLNGITVNAADQVLVGGSIATSIVEDTSVAADPQFTTTAGVFNGVTGTFAGGRMIQNGTGIVVKLANTGGAQLAFTLGGADQDTVRAVAYDTEDNIYCTGFTQSFNMQRTPGAFQQDFSTPQIFVTKLVADASAIQYSTGLRSVGNVTPTAIAVDGRGNCYVGGIVGFNLNSPFPGLFIPSTPGSIPVTDRANGDPETAIDPDYNGGDTSVDVTNTGDDDADLPSTTDGFLSVFNPAGSALQYSSYIGEDSDDRVTDVFVDSVGGCWVAGYSQVVWNHFVNSGPRSSGDAPKENGIGGHITANAFKTSIPGGGPTGNSPDFGASNGWIVKHRVVLPRLVGVGVGPTSAPGGYGASSTVTVTLEDPAPTGGVNLILTTSNASATSWDPSSSVLTLPITVPEGSRSTTATIYTLPVVSNQVSSIIATLDNDFKETRLTVLPWLSDMSVSPLVTQGGNNLTLTVNLSDFAPAGGVPVNLSTDRPDLVLLPNPAEVDVPQNAKNAQITIPTAGVDVSTTVQITASFLGVSKTKTVTLNPAKLKDFTFAPSRVNRGDDSTATVRFFGKTGIARNLTISHVSGDTGSLVNGQALPVTLVVPAQTDQISFTVTSPLTISAGFETMKADDTFSSVNGTLNIDPIDILDLVISPALDVTGGTVLTGQVTLTRPAGPNGMTINVNSTNSFAGVLSTSTVFVPAGQTSSSSFNFNTAINPNDQTTNIHATKTGFADKYRTVIVRGITLSLTLNPTAVRGGEASSTGTISLSRPAPTGGLVVVLNSSDTTVAYMSPSTITIPEGDSSATFPVLTKKTPVQKTSTITAQASPLVKSSKVLTVNPPAITSFTITPNSVLGGTQSKGTLTFSSTCPAGTVVTLSASPGGIVTIPSSVTVTAGLKQYSFLINTKAVASTVQVNITATLAPTQKTAAIIVRSPGLGGLTFSPARVQGTLNSTGTITLTGPAPAGGISVTLSSNNPAVADIIGSKTIVIGAGKFSATFPVKTNRVSRTVAVKFTATSSAGTISGNLYVDP